MQTAALYHVNRSPYAYPVGEAHLRVVLRAARGDLAAATCVYGDRYLRSPDSDSPAAMERLGDDGTHEFWGVTIPAPTRRVRYLLYVEGADGTYGWLTEMGLTARRPNAGFFQYAYIHRSDAFRQPGWIRDAVFYQIFPDRFCNGDPSNDPPEVQEWGKPPTPEYMAGGDLAGIRQKLDYIEDLGVTCVYTTPIFLAPTNHKYDTTDYYTIDPSFGTNEEFRLLVQEAHRRGIRFMLDAVFNHSGKEWFAFRDVIENGAKSRYADWFYDLHSFPVDPAKINYETFATGVANMPKLNTGNPECAEYLLQVAEHWIREFGIDGWRLDVANEVDHRFWRKFRERVKGAKADAFILGEIWHEAQDWLQGDQYDSVMNYPWREAVVQFLQGQMDAVEFDRELTRQRFLHPAEIARGMLNLLGSHDTARIRTLLGGLEKAVQAAVLLLTSEGVPLVYYGDEIGMEGANDPDCRRCYPWGRLTEENRRMLSLYRRLIAIRRTFPWLNDGAWETFVADPITGLFGYRRLPTPLVAPVRPPDEEGIYVVINNSGREATVPIPADDEVVDLLAGQLQTGTVKHNVLELPARGVAVLAPRALAAKLPPEEA